MKRPLTLTELSEYAQTELSDSNPDIELEELFPRSLMRSGYFRADSITVFFENSPIEQPTGRYDSLHTPEFHQYVQTQTVFDSWEEMLRYARKEWVAREWEKQYPNP